METFRRQAACWQIGSLLILGLTAFWPSVWFDFVNWDDPAYVEHNELIRSWSPSSLAGIATETVTRNYAPLTILSLLVDHSIWGMNPCGYHATNVLLHLINGVLVFLLLRQLTKSSFVAWTTAALFLVHPVQTETVAWISSRKGLLSASFMLSALLLRLRPAVSGRQEAGYLGLLAAALLSKALAVVVPPFVLLYDVLIRREKLTEALPRQVIPGCMAVLLLLKTMGAQNAVLGGVRGHMDLPLWHILAIDITILWQYIRMLFCPTGLSVLYDPPTTGIALQVILGGAAWAAVAAVLWFQRHRHPLFLLGAAGFLLLLFPVLNFFRITTLMNDRYLYLPCIIVFALCAALIRRVFEVVADDAQEVLRWVSAGGKSLIAGTAVALALIMTNGYLPVWKNSQTLWTDAMQKAPQLAVVRIQMAHTLHDRGQVREAIRVMQLALVECQPDAADRERMQDALSTWNREAADIRSASAGQDRRESTR